MSGQIILGEGKELRAVADDAFLAAMKDIPERMTERLAFMTPDHHLVRDFVVREMPRQNAPLSPRQIAGVTGLDLNHVGDILSELERKLFFLVRDRDGNVSWAFPVTTARTAHRLEFSTGERISGA